MKFTLNETEKYGQSEILEKAEEARSYVDKLNEVVVGEGYESQEASINLPADKKLLVEVEELAKEKVLDKLKYIFVVGIGGSNLGTKAIYDALYGYKEGFSDAVPKMIFVDTNNTNQLQFYVETLIPSIGSSEEFLFITISKSGGTTETMVNTEILLSALTAKLGDIKDRVLVITDEGSPFWQEAEKAQMSKLSIPENVGGRYSVFSAVGLFPLRALGLDIEALRQGAFDMRTLCLDTDVDKNPALKSAVYLALALTSGKTIHDTFVFNSELESLGKWYRQLLGESIGKEFNLAGETVNTGLTPTVSVGSTDLHSVAQLYLGGPKDKVTTFVYSNTSASLNVPEKRFFPEVVEMIDGKNTNDIMQAILEGTKIAYQKKGLPYMEILLSEISPYELGSFMQFKMFEVMYLGHLLKINPFNQPNVEDYKTETKNLLQS